MASQLIKLFIKMHTSRKSAITAKIKIIALIILFFINHALNAHHSSAMFNKNELKITQRISAPIQISIIFLDEYLSLK